MNFDPPISHWPDGKALGAMTDLYELTMMAGYLSANRGDIPATFELFVRKLPPHRAYLVFAGLEQFLADLLDLRLTRGQIDQLRTWPVFRHLDPSIIDAFHEMRFEGDVWSVPEGTVVFPGETLVRVTAPLAQAQWIETLLIASLAYPTLVASKASRIVSVARGKQLWEFGARRGQGPAAGLLAARGAYIAGFSGTSLVEAGLRFGIPVVGTMAHSWIQSFDSESEAFAAYAGVYPGNTSLLVDTYDTLEGVRLAATIEPPIQGIRIDSGNLAAQATAARSILDEHGRQGVRIVLSGDLEEWQIEKLVAEGVPVDGFGVGTELITSRDAPALAMVYKLVELAGKGKIKLSAGKRTYPMAKQVYRRLDRQGRFRGDHVTRADETAEGEPLLVPILRAGRLVADLPSLETIRVHCQQQLAALPESLMPLDAAPAYPVTYSDRLEADARALFSR